MTRSPNTEINFFRLTGLELLFAGGWTLFIALSQSLHTTTLLAVVVMVAGLVTLAAPFFLKSYIAKLVSVLNGRLGQLAAVAVPVVLVAFLFLRTPNIDALKIIGPILVCIWLIGIEVLFFFQTPREATQEQNTANYLSILSILLGYSILLIPSRVPALLDGFPWNTPLEFITATLILPFAFFFGRSFLSKKAVTLLFALLLVAKLTLSFFLPQSGLGVHVYFSEAELASNTWAWTYALNSSYSEVAQLPYRSFLEFPVESINTHGFDKNLFWMTMKVDGFISLDEDERLVIILQGADQRQLELIELITGESVEVATAKSVDDLDAEMFSDLPYVGNAELKGSLLFKNYGNGRFEPVILSSDGSIRSAYSQIWLSKPALDFPTGIFQLLQNLILVLFVSCILWSLWEGLSTSYRSGVIDILDIYLALTSLSLYYTAGVAEKLPFNFLLLPVAFILVIVKLFDFILRSSSYFTKAYLLALGLPILLMFLTLDLPNLQSVVLLPQHQDVSDYQVLARNIYVVGDFFLLKTPPWAFKFLYPYIIGMLHILFGQSLASQLFLNAWSAILTVALITRISIYFGTSDRIAFLVGNFFFLQLIFSLSFVLYFRFGLIEPISIMALLLTLVFAIQGEFGLMVALGLIVGMLRLNFVGVIFTSIALLAPGMQGGFYEAWSLLIDWAKSNWKRILVYLIAIPLPAVVVAAMYLVLKSNYVLVHSINRQSSAGSIMNSLITIAMGGDIYFVKEQFQNNPLELILISAPLILGFFIATLSLTYRQGIFKKVDLRLGILLLSMVPVYIVLVPTAYFPRYSWSFMPFALILLGLVLQLTVLRDNKAFQDTQ
ncbi:MAG: hypothetical protein U0X74_05755 [Anaerolineales bacterium]